jgi:hypothetical protein
VGKYQLPLNCSTTCSVGDSFPPSAHAVRNSFVPPAPRAFFRPDHKSCSLPRARPVKAGRVFAAARQGLALIRPSTAVRLSGSGSEAPSTFTTRLSIRKFLIPRHFPQTKPRATAQRRGSVPRHLANPTPAPRASILIQKSVMHVASNPHDPRLQDSRFLFPIFAARHPNHPRTRAPEDRHGILARYGQRYKGHS